MTFLISKINKRAQFEKMAKLIKTTPSELARAVLQMPKEVRFRKLKQYYAQTIPESKEFYKMFSKKPKVTSRKENDYYDNIETLNDVMSLIEDVDRLENNEVTNELEQNARLDENNDDLLQDDVMFQNFIDHKEGLYEKYSPFKKKKHH